MNQNTKRRWLAALLGAAAGMVVFFLLYGTSTLHPTYDAWILNGYDEWDIQQHYAGWVLFRNSHWAFPLGLADTIAAPDGTVISFTDSIPWVSIFFKALRGVLPSTFQWFGWYTLFCFAMQGAAGALLCARRQAKTGVGALVFSTLGGLLFVMLPTLWERAFRHTALASQWLFLLALYAFLEYRQNLHSGTAKFPWAMPVLAFLAVGIHPYFLPLVMMCALLAAVELGRQKKAWGRAALQFAASLAAAVVGGVLCGAIGSGTGASRSGYGDYSMNLNALINPTSRGGYTWSRLYQVMPQQPGQYDGFNYLGLGVLALITAALLFSLRRAVRCPQNTKTWWHRNGPVFAACVFLTLFAVSNKIYWGNTGIELPLSAKLLELCGIFRSSGRMFYLVAACMVVYAVYTLRDRLPGRYAVLVLALFFGAMCLLPKLVERPKDDSGFAGALYSLRDNMSGVLRLVGVEEDPAGIHLFQTVSSDISTGTQVQFSITTTKAVQNVRLMDELGVTVPAGLAEQFAAEGKTPLFFAKNGELVGTIAVADEVKETSAEAIAALRKLGVDVRMLTGDNRVTAEAIARRVGLSSEQVIADVLPADKERHVCELQDAGGKVAMVGDGINDSPALARADVGLAIGTGADIAKEGADVVLMRSDLMDVARAIELSRATIRNIKQDLFWALFYNGIGIPLAAGVFFPLTGWQLSPMFGAAAMSLSSVCVVSNALRLKSFKPKTAH